MYIYYICACIQIHVHTNISQEDTSLEVFGTCATCVAARGARRRERLQDDGLSVAVMAESITHPVEHILPHDPQQSYLIKVNWSSNLRNTHKTKLSHCSLNCSNL